MVTALRIGVNDVNGTEPKADLFAAESNVRGVTVSQPTLFHTTVHSLLWVTPCESDKRIPSKSSTLADTHAHMHGIA